MPIDTGDELVQDFLIECREILDALGNQLVDLEQQPDDRELLNAVFRGFHTIKGGAGFLGLEALVAVCHRAEDVFNQLRQGERAVDPQLMDVMLRVLDVVLVMFDEVAEGQDPAAAPSELLAQLDVLMSGAAPEPPAPVPPAADAPAQGAADDITDDEFEALLDALDQDQPEAPPAASPAPSGAGPDDITDDEFEDLLDQLHGTGAPGTAAPADPLPAGNGDSDTISEGEFEALLDQLHGSGGAPGADAGAPGQDKVVQFQQEAESAPASTAPAAPVAREHAGAAPRGETTVRVDTKRLDDIMNLVGELVLVRNRLTTLHNTNDHERFGQAVSDLELVTSDLQAAVMKTRMQPVKKVFGRFPRVVRDLARSLEKDVQLLMEGEETDLDKNLVEALADPLVHLVRNSVDHGVEAPDVRVANGKPRTGTIRLAAKQEGDHILLTIEDDGGGMDPEFIRQLAIDKGVIDADAAARLDPSECFGLIFMPGFSTRNEISDVSGRGVGMDVVKTRITQLNGTIDIHSVQGQGTRIDIRLPLTLAILPTLMVSLKGRKLAIPMSVVHEILELSEFRTSVVDGQRVIIVRDKAMPLFYLSRWAMGGASRTQESAVESVVAVRLGNQTVGLVVDQVVGLEEVVIKPLDRVLQGLPGLAGSTITGDGRVALIVDVPGLLRSHSTRLQAS